MEKSKSRTFSSRKLIPEKEHLVRKGEIWDLRKDVNHAIAVLEKEAILPVSFSFGGMLPTFPPNPNPGEVTYGICSAMGPLAPLGHIYVWNVYGEVSHVDIEKNTFIYLEVDLSGTALNMSAGLYRATNTLPTWEKIVDTSSSGTTINGHIISDGSTTYPQRDTLTLDGVAVSDGGMDTVVRFPISTSNPTERAALQHYNGLLVWASDLNSLLVYNNGSWATV
jgi:hypothetical protein